MIIKKEIDSFDEFEAWSGGLDTLRRLREIGVDQDIFNYLDSMYVEMDETELNDYLWFEDKDMEEYLGFDFWKYDSFDAAKEAEDGRD